MPPLALAALQNAGTIPEPTATTYAAAHEPTLYTDFGLTGVSIRGPSWTPEEEEWRST